jgi:hypothetical protein
MAHKGMKYGKGYEKPTKGLEGLGSPKVEGSTSEKATACQKWEKGSADGWPYYDQEQEKGYENKAPTSGGGK